MKKETKNTLKTSISLIILNAKVAYDFFLKLQNNDNSTLEDYEKFLWELHDINSDNYMEKGKSRLYYAPSLKFGLNKIKELYPRHYKKILKQLEKLNINLNKMYEYKHSDNVFKQLKDTQKARNYNFGRNSDFVSTITEKIEETYDNLNVSYYIKNQIDKKSDELLLRESRIYKKDINLDEVPQEILDKEEIVKLAEKYMAKELDKKKTTTKNQNNNQQEVVF